MQRSAILVACVLWSLLSLAPLAAGAQVRGDADCSGEVTDADLAALRSRIFSEDRVSCPDADVNRDSRVNAADLPVLLNFLRTRPAPRVMFLGLASSNGQAVTAVGTLPDGTAVYYRNSGFGFRLVVEAEPTGPRGARTGTRTFNDARDDPTRRPDLQIQTNRVLGDGSRAVCDEFGIRAVDPPSFALTQEISDSLNDFGCRFLTATNRNATCTVNSLGQADFLSAGSGVQFCFSVGRDQTFPPDETIITARVRDEEGNLGPERKLMVIVGSGPPPPTFTAAPPTPTHTATRSPTQSPTVTRTRTRTSVPTTTNSRTRTYTATRTNRPDDTPTATFSVGSTSTRSPTRTPSPRPTTPGQPTGTFTRTGTRTRTPTVTLTPRFSFTPTRTGTATRSSTATATRPPGTSTATPTRTPTTIFTRTRTNTPTVTRTTALTPATPTRTITRTRTPTPTPGLENGPLISYFAVLRPDDTVLEPTSTTPDGIPIYQRPFGFGFNIAIEAVNGPSARPPGRSGFGDGFPPDLQIQVTRPLGNGSAEVCDDGVFLPFLGGVPAISPPSFANNQLVTDRLNDFGCRFVDGSGLYQGRECRDGCIRDPAGDYGCGFPDSRVQYCGLISRSLEFPSGDTTVSFRVLDNAGNAGEVKQLIIRITPP